MTNTYDPFQIIRAGHNDDKKYRAIQVGGDIWMATAKASSHAAHSAVEVTRPSATGRFVIVCDHASNSVPARFGTLGLDAPDLDRHIAWDPGALGVAEALSALLDAPLVASRISRLVVDCNRPLDAPDLIVAQSDLTPVPGNANLSDADRDDRVALSWTPFHEAVDAVISGKLSNHVLPAVIAVHSFTPHYKGTRRTMDIGILHDDDMRLSTPLLAALRAIPGLRVADNEPYSPADRVYYTLERHARSRGLPCVMIEIRNDLIDTPASQRSWAERLAAIFAGLEQSQQRAVGA